MTPVISLMLSIILPIVIRILAYGFALYALWAITADVRREITRRMWFRVGHRRLIRKTQDHLPTKRVSTIWHRHIQMLITSSLDRTSSTLYSAIVFTRITVILFVVTGLAILWTTHSVQIMFVSAFMVGSSPYIALRYRLYNQRLARANQIQILIQLLLSSYRIQHQNIYFALRDTADQLHLHRSSLARPLVRLTASVQSVLNDEDLLRALEVFVYDIGSSLAQQLGAILCTALILKKPIEHQLQSLDEEITKIKKTLDEEKAERFDNFGLGFLPIFAFPVVELFLWWQSGTKFMQLQFSGLGTAYFTLALLGSVVALLLSLFSRRPKLDL